MSSICLLYLILIILILLIICSYLRFVYQLKKLKRIFESMDIYLVKRWHSIPAILDFLKEDKQRNDNAYNEIQEKLKYDYKSMSSEEKVNFNNEVEQHLDNLINTSFAASDANDNSLFVAVRKEHVEIEKNLDNIENYYNSMVSKYNKRVNRFPSNIIATIFSFKEKQLFNPSILNEEAINKIKVN